MSWVLAQSIHCAHGVAACAKIGYYVYNYISKYYTIETLWRTYASVAHAIGSPDNSAFPADVKSLSSKRIDCEKTN